MLTAERLRSLLDYNQETGIFTWKIYRAPNANAGDTAGVLACDGYRQIYVDGRPYKAHRLAWLWVTGQWPSAFIDHRDTDRTNNSWVNLREASKAQNAANCSARSSNTSGFKGVTFDKAKHRWMAQIQVNRRCRHLGYYDTPTAAHEAYAVAALEIHGEFGRAA